MSVSFPRYSEYENESGLAPSPYSETEDRVNRTLSKGRKFRDLFVSLAPAGRGRIRISLSDDYAPGVDSGGRLLGVFEVEPPKDASEDRLTKFLVAKVHWYIFRMNREAARVARSELP